MISSDYTHRRLDYICDLLIQINRMSKRSVRNSRGKLDIRLQPTILRRKRKAVKEFEGSERENEVSKRRQEYENQACWDPGSQESNTQSENCYSVPSTTTSASTSSSSKQMPDGQRTPSDMLPSLTFSQFRGLTCILTPEAHNKRDSPLPHFSWADPQEVWELMVQKDSVYPRDPKLLCRHPGLQARMRAILLDWLIEVCEVYRLHRESFYLAQDFIDRYLANQENVPKQQLQLLGITALFVAAKIEEIYPPKLSEFAYVTDGACTETEILEKELVLLKTLNWDLTPMTINSWLNIYLQLADDPSSTRGDDFLVPDYSGHIFVQVAQLMDLCILDVGCLQFPYSVVAASALCHVTSENLATSVSGLKKNELAACVQWMVPFAKAVKENGEAQLKFFHQVTLDDMHNIQTHSVNLQLLEKAQAFQVEAMMSVQASPQSEYGALTPPQSSEKESSDFSSPL